MISEEFVRIFQKAKSVVAISGAGISAESGIPTFRGSGGYWRKYEATSLASPHAFRANPSLVWEFYHYRRSVVEKCKPNPGHYALAQLEELMNNQDKEFLLITQNVDGLHKVAGSKNLIEIHGSLRQVKCTKCNAKEYWNHPICSSLAELQISADFNEAPANLDTSVLPKCGSCGALSRPDIVWFGENLNEDNLSRAIEKANTADVLLVIGTSSVVYPVAMIAPDAAANGSCVCEINLDQTPQTHSFDFHISGKSGDILPQIVNCLK